MDYLYAIVLEVGLLLFLIGVLNNRFGKRELGFYNNKKIKLSNRQIVFLRIGFSIVGLCLIVISLYKLIEW